MAYRTAFGDKNENHPLKRTNNNPEGTTVIGEDNEKKRPKPPKSPSTPKLTSSVGVAGRNHRDDVIMTEKLLSDAGTFDLKPTDGPTGYWGMRMEDATKRFQKEQGLKVDIQINPIGHPLTGFAGVLRRFRWFSMPGTGM